MAGTASCSGSVTTPVMRAVVSCARKTGISRAQTSTAPNLLRCEAQKVFVVLIADVFQDVVIRRENPFVLNFPRPQESVRVLNSDLHPEMPQVRAPVAFHDVKLLGVRVEIQPATVVETDGVDGQSVALPMADRVTCPGRADVLGMGASVQEDLPVPDHIFKHLQQQRWGLRD